MIAQVEGERLDNLSEAEVISRILGAHGSKVSLTIRVHEGQVDSKVDRDRVAFVPHGELSCALCHLCMRSLFDMVAAVVGRARRQGDRGRRSAHAVHLRNSPAQGVSMHTQC
jgi:hypothetical protein